MFQKGAVKTGAPFKVYSWLVRGIKHRVSSTEYETTNQTPDEKPIATLAVSNSEFMH